MENLVEVKHLTKDYGFNRGVFDVSFELRKGEILGFVGSNGAGKTTILRNIMGFIKPDSGEVKVCGLDSWKDSAEAKKYVGYIPGEIAFPDLKTGVDFMKSQAEFLNVTDMSYSNYLIEKLQLDPTANLKRMSKGMKQKTAIVASLMGNPDVLFLDEPTTGLDPLMRTKFLEIIEEENKKGKTILITSHLYEELEKICDRVALIDKGKIVSILDMSEINDRKVIDYKIEFNSESDYNKFLKLKQNVIRKQSQYNQVTIRVEKEKISEMFKILKDFDVKFISEVKYTLEKYFNEVIKEYHKENSND